MESDQFDAVPQSSSSRTSGVAPGSGRRATDRIESTEEQFSFDLDFVEAEPSAAQAAPVVDYASDMPARRADRVYDRHAHDRFESSTAFEATAPEQAYPEQAYAVDADIAALDDVASLDEAATDAPFRAESRWVSMSNGEQLHLRHFIPAQAGPHTESVFMLHGEVECGRIFYDDGNRGLANFLAAQGFEVFVADLGGRGRSLTVEGQWSALSVHALITEAIPRLLQAASDAAASQSPPGIWMTHGFGGVLMSAAWARLPEALRTADRIVMFGSRRKVVGASRLASWFVKLLCHPLTARWVNWRRVFPATRLKVGSADENADWFRVYSHWLRSVDWHDLEDGFDYRQALADNPLPCSLSVAAVGDGVYASPLDVRHFVEELGCHDARLLLLDKKSGGREAYNHLTMLLDSAAVGDVFEEVLDWLWLKRDEAVAAERSGLAETCDQDQVAA